MPDRQNPAPTDPTEGLSIASELISARNERGFTQAQLAELSGVSRSAIKAYETGRNMPGSRELRALCVALQCTPNRLLFGTEAPTFGSDDAAKFEALLRSDPEEAQLARARLAGLSSLLTGDEYRSVLHLVHSLAVARHGVDRVKDVIASADFVAAMFGSMLEQGAVAERTGAPVDPQAVVQGAAKRMQREGHGSADDDPPSVQK
ncbi:MAG TPA: XRE family transcriptional regulator [Methylibium sp.]|nr:XRE family transcriptional regulator [Methylibium sp.]